MHILTFVERSQPKTQVATSLGCSPTFPGFVIFAHLAISTAISVAHHKAADESAHMQRQEACSSLPAPSSPPTMPQLPLSLPLAPPLASVILREDPYLIQLESWRAAKRVTSHGPSPPPKPDLRAGTADQQERRLAAFTAATLEWEPMKAAWKEANGKRKRQRRAERDAERPPTAEVQQRSEKAQKLRVALTLRARARRQPFPLVTPALFIEMKELTRQLIEAGADADATELRKCWKRLSGQRLADDSWFGSDQHDMLMGPASALHCVRSFFLWTSSASQSGYQAREAGSSWTGTSLTFHLPQDFKGESADPQLIGMTVRIGKHKPLDWEDTDSLRDIPYELERGLEYGYECSSAGCILSFTECAKSIPLASSAPSPQQSTWMTELLLNSPSRYDEVQRVNRKIERRNQFTAAIPSSFRFWEPAHVDYVVDGTFSPLDSDYLTDHWDHFGNSTASGHADSVSSHSSDDSDGVDAFIRSEQKRSWQQRLELQKEWDAGTLF